MKATARSDRGPASQKPESAGADEPLSENLFDLNSYDYELPADPNRTISAKETRYFTIIKT